jgi:hypothetical protein
LNGSKKPTYSSVLRNANFFKTSGMFLHLGITTNPEKQKAVWEWSTPEIRHEMSSIFGPCSYYRRFISGFANIVKPLTKLVAKNQAYMWTSEVEATFKRVKEPICTAPVLACPQP